MLVLERALFIDNLLVRIHLIIVMIRWSGLAPWEFEFPFPGAADTLAVGGGARERRALGRAHVRGGAFFFIITPKPRVERYKSL